MVVGSDNKGPGVFLRGNRIMYEIVECVREFLVESGYVWETNGSLFPQNDLAYAYVWRGPGKYEPVMYMFQFIGLIKGMSCDSSDRFNIWCQYTDLCDHPVDVTREFLLSDPGVFDNLLLFLDGHDKNAHKLYGGEFKYQRSKRLSEIDEKCGG